VNPTSQAGQRHLRVSAAMTRVPTIAATQTMPTSPVQKRVEPARDMWAPTSIRFQPSSRLTSSGAAR
jgi:hypothetical protein